jgi:hypothetical protein
MIYLILAPKSAVPHAVCNQLIQTGFDTDQGPFAVLSSNTDRTEFPESIDFFPLGWDAQTETLDGIPVAEQLQPFGTIFWILDGLSDPRPQLEIIQEWLQGHPEHLLGNIFTIVNCAQLYANPSLRAWYDCCIHFSDAVLLNQRNDVPNRWISEFQDHFEKLCYPCLFSLVKKNLPQDATVLIYPEPRRIAHLFEPELEPFELDESSESDDETELTEAEEDPWLLKNLGGQYQVHLPSIE